MAEGANSAALRRFRGWVFDLDGTLTRPVHDFAHIRQALGIAADADILATIAAYPETKRCTMMAHLDQLEHHYAAQAQPSEGALALLQALQQRNIPLGILTRNSRAIAQASLVAIGAAEFFPTHQIIGRDEAPPKPDGAGLKSLIDQWGVSPSEAVMVGDFRYDLETGRAVGVYTVHVDERDRAWPDLTDLRVNTLSDLLTFL